jgi:hypothetical protein
VIELALVDRMQTHGDSLHRGSHDSGLHFRINIKRAELNICADTLDV